MRLRLRILLLAGAAIVACSPAGPEGSDRTAGTESGAGLSVSRALGDDDAEGYLRATEPRDFAFPADHGPHPGFRTEWWYFTGNLDGPAGQRYGFQLTFFRNALTPPGKSRADGRESAWAADEAWLAHFAVTTGESFHAAERLARGAAGLAGVELGEGGRLRVWTEDWSIEPEGEASGSPAALAPLRLRAARSRDGGGPAVAIDLRLRAIRPPFLHGRPGEEGLSRKGDAPGAASYYYTVPRFETRGTVTVDGEAVPVRGLSWLDREWSTSVLSEGQAGWDWFALQLDDGRDLMLYLLRREDGGIDPASSGSVMPPPRGASDFVENPARDGRGRPSLPARGERDRGREGRSDQGAAARGAGDFGESAVHLGADDFRVEVLGRWRSPAGGVYPSGWRIRVPSAELDLTVEPVRDDQELDLPGTGLRYWEGAVDARGTSAGRPVAGRGYVELTGYAEAHGGDS